MPDLRVNMVQVHIYRFRDGQPEFLLLKRAPDEPLYPNVWQVITGGIEDGESSPAAAIREVLEETGMHPLSMLPLPDVAMFYSNATDRIVLSPMFSCEVPSDAEPRLSEEHIEYAWLDIENAVGRSIFPSQQRGLRQVHDLITSL